MIKSQFSILNPQLSIISTYLAYHKYFFIRVIRVIRGATFSILKSHNSPLEPSLNTAQPITITGTTQYHTFTHLKLRAFIRLTP